MTARSELPRWSLVPRTPDARGVERPLWVPWPWDGEWRAMLRAAGTDPDCNNLEWVVYGLRWRVVRGWVIGTVAIAILLVTGAIAIGVDWTAGLGLMVIAVAIVAFIAFPGGQGTPWEGELTRQCGPVPSRPPSGPIGAAELFVHLGWCASCAHRLDETERRAGREVVCPECGAAWRWPRSGHGTR